MNNTRKGGFAMNIGDRIKSFRNLKQLTQKALAERSNISEIAIKKYETGERNPRPEQITKIAEALEINENLLYNIDLSDLPLITIGDLMAIFIQLFESVGIIPRYMHDSNGKIEPSTITLQFTNMNINNAIKQWIEDYERYTYTIDLLNQRLRKKELSQEEYDELFITTNTMLELTKRSLIENYTLLNKED